MIDPQTWVVTLPAAPAEVPLLSAAGLIPLLAEPQELPACVQRLRIHDPVVRTAALSRLLEPGTASQTLEVVNMAMHVAPRSAHVRKRLLPWLIKGFRFDLLAQLLEIEKKCAPTEALLQAQLIKATFDNDYEQQVQLHERLFLQNGDVQHVWQAWEVSSSRLGWRAAYPCFLRNVLAQTRPVQVLCMSFLQLLERENAQDEFRAVAGLVKKLESAKLCTAYAMAQNWYWKGDYAKCLDFLHKSNALKATDGKVSSFVHLAATAAEKLGHYAEAAEYYQRQNEVLKRNAPPPERYIEDLQRRAQWAIGPLPEDKHHHHFIMTGFPRSGTTLLENVLASHPDVATCEETSSLIGSLSSAYKLPLKNDPKGENLTLRAERHRMLYYRNMARHVRKPEAKVVIDKTPIIGSNIKYLEKLFPAKRYIFSIRHPYDVVLSNFKQDYSQNVAMAAFNDMYTACVLYHHVMSDWFEVFPGDTPRVHYIKYDDLVNNFEPVVRGALDFLGVPWTDEVNHFAENAAKRAVRTPSYTNVRKGLTIGVQSSWQHFDFLFDDRCRALLDPWVQRFGY